MPREPDRESHGSQPWEEVKAENSLAARRPDLAGELDRSREPDLDLWRPAPGLHRTPEPTAATSSAAAGARVNLGGHSGECVRRGVPRRSGAASARPPNLNAPLHAEIRFCGIRLPPPEGGKPRARVRARTYGVHSRARLAASVARCVRSSSTRSASSTGRWPPTPWASRASSRSSSTSSSSRNEGGGEGEETLGWENAGLINDRARLGRTGATAPKQKPTSLKRESRESRRSALPDSRRAGVGFWWCPALARVPAL